jgi:[protein-PII] uridylyltransferase
MCPLQSTTIEAGFALAEPLDGDRLEAARSLPGRDDVAAPAGSVRHVLRAIASDPAEALDRRRWLTRVRPLVERAEAGLHRQFEADGSGAAFLRGRSRLADGAVIGLLHLARAVVRTDDVVVTALAPVTVLAVGGYGRRELAPASDLDLLFLTDDDSAVRRAYAERLIGFVLTGLWDLGFEIGHAARTVAECERLASADPTVLASLLDSRFLTGSFGLYGRLDAGVTQIAKEMGAEALAAALVPRFSAPFEARRIARDEDEPDVKRGRGALRDIQRLLWIARLRHGHDAPSRQPGAADRAAGAPCVLIEARRFLWQVRCHLHLLTGRAQDRLIRELQPRVARRLGLGHGIAGVAELLGRHRAHTDSVRALLAVA